MSTRPLILLIIAAATGCASPPPAPAPGLAQAHDLARVHRAALRFEQAQAREQTARQDLAPGPALDAFVRVREALSAALDLELEAAGLCPGCRVDRFDAGPTPPAIDTLVVARRDGLVLLAAGSDGGVTRGLHFSVYRDETFVGKVVVERVAPALAGCRLLFVADGQQVREGDRAATRSQ